MTGVRALLNVVILLGCTPIGHELLIWERGPFQRWLHGPFTAWCTAWGERTARRIRGDST